MSRSLTNALLFAVAYVAATELGHLLSLKPGPIATLWPAAGLFVGVLLASPVRRWAGVVAVASGANLFSDVALHGKSPLFGAALTAANAAEALAAAALLRWWRGAGLRLDRLGDLAAFLAAALAGPILGATLGSAAVAWATGDPSAFAATWPIWWTGDVVGVLVIGPPVLMLMRPTGEPSALAARPAEAAAMIAAVAAAAEGVFAGALPMVPPSTLAPLMLWPAVRFGVGGVSAATAALALVAVSNTLTGRGPYVTGAAPGPGSVVAVQAFTVAFAVSFLVVAALFAERRRLVDSLARVNRGLERRVDERTAELRSAHAVAAEREVRFRDMADGSPVGIWVTDPTGRCTFVNRTWSEWTGQTPEQGLGYGWLEAVHPDDRPVAEEAFRSANAGRQRFRVEYRVRRADGSYRWALDAAEPRFGTDGEYLGYVGSVTDIDERKRAELAAGQARAEFQLLVNSIPEAVYAALPDATGSTLFVSDRYTEFSGQTLADFGADPEAWPKSIHPDDRDRTLAAYRDAHASGRDFDCEYRLVHRGTGRVRWVRDHGSAVRDASGRVVRVIGTIADVTDRRRTEDALRESELSLRQVIDSIPGMVFTNRPDGSCDFVSERWVAFTGIPAERQLGEGWVQVLHPDDRERAFAAWRAAVEDRGSYDLEYRVRRHDGVYEWFKVQGRPIRDAAGRIVRWFGTGLSIDGLKRADDALRESEHRLRLFIENAPAGVAMFDRDMRYLAASRRWLSDYRLSADVVGRCHYDVFPGEIPERWREAHRRGLAGEPLRSYGDRFDRSDGTTQWLKWEVLPWRTASGAVGGILIAAEDVTERKLAEDALRESEAKHRFIVEATSDAVWRFDLDVPADPAAPVDEQLEHLWRHARLAECNEGMARTYGFPSAASMIGRPLEEFMPRSRPANAAYMRAFVESGHRLVDAESEEVGADGRRMWFLNTLVGITRDGKVIGAWGTSRDITERKAAEDTLRESEQRHRALFESIDEGFCVAEMIFDAEGRPADYRFLEVNAAFERHTGLRGAPGRTARELVPDLDPFWFETYGRVALTGEPVRFENHAPAMNRWFEVHASRMGGPESRRVAIVFNDVTGRRRAEEAVRESEDRFRTLADNIPQLAWMADPTGWIFWFNRRWFDYTGTTPEQMQGWGWKAVHHPDHVERVVEKFRGCIERGEPWEDTFPLRGADGVYRWFLSRALPIRGADGRVVRWFGSNTDVTAQREAEEELRRAGRMKDEFLLTLSHELRTPMTAIAGWVSLLRGGGLSPAEAADALEVVDRNVRAQTRLIEDLLDVSRIVSGKMTLEARPVRPAEVVSAAVEVVRPAAEAKGVALAVETPLAAGFVAGDPDRLQQVAWNLLSNAVKFTPAGGRVTVALRAGAGRMVLTVADTGEGIDRDFLPFVFDRFRQADGSTTRRHGGLGLGLAIVRQVTELHGGTVSADSPGRGLGAVFTVDLPMIVEPARPGGGGGATSVLSGRPLAGLRVLVVDDTPDTLRMLAVMLKAGGAAVRTADSSAAALAAVEEQAPDVLVTDIGMPGEDGLSLLARLRTRPAGRGGAVPAVALTGFAGEHDRRRCLDAGFQTHLPKPVELDALLGAVAAAAGRRTVRMQSGSLDRVAGTRPGC